MKILYVEDNPNDADLARRRLRKHAPEFELEVVATQSEAVSRLSGKDAFSFDMVLTDLQLPDGDGISLLTYIRERGMPLAVVVITGMGDERTAVTAIKAGADDYVSKRDDYLERLPFTLENALCARRAQATRQSRTLKALYAEHYDSDIDLTLRHFRRYAPHIQLDVAPNGAEALQRLSQAGEANRYDVILLDYRLPGLNALEVLKEMRQGHALDTPVVLVTGQGDEEVALQALKLGAASYLVKNHGYLHQLPAELENACYRADIIREQAALRQSEERFRSAFDHATIGMALIDLDGRFLQVNRSVCELFGYSEQELIGGNFKSHTHPDDLDSNLTFMRRLVAGEMQSFQMEKRYIHKRGHLVWALVSVSLLRDGDGRPIYFISQIQDVTEWKQGEEALRESEARFRNLADNAPVMVWMSDAEGAGIYGSPSWYEFTGQTPESGLGSGWVAALHPDDRELTEKTFLAANEKHEAFRIEYRLRRKDGEYRWVIDSARPRFDSQGEFLGYIGSVVDITETKRAELNTQFINQLDFELSQIADADEIIRLATGRLGQYLDATSCYVLEVNPEADLAVVRESWHGWRLDGKSIVGEYRISDFTTLEFREMLEAGQAAVVNDVRTDPRTRDFVATYEAFGVGAYVTIPALNERRWEASLNVNHPQARDWRPDETQLMRDITARLWPTFKRARAVEALRESEERLRLALEAGRMGVWEWDVETDALKWSKEHYTIMGVEPFSVDPKNYRVWVDRVHPDDIPVATRAIRRAIEEKGEYRCEYRVIWPDGSVRWVEGRGRPVFDERGQCLKVNGLIADITDRKQAEDMLRQSEARYRAIVEDQTELVCRVLPDGRYTFVNDAYCRYFGRKFEELIGSTFQPFIHPEDAVKVNQLLASITPSNPVGTIEHRVVLPDGGVRWQQWTERGIFDEQGRLIEFQCVGRDVTQRKHAEDQLMESEAQLRLLTELIPQHIWTAFPGNKTDYCSQRWLDYTGMTIEEVHQKGWMTALHPDDQERVFNAQREASSQKGNYEVELRLRRFDGKYRWFLARGIPQFDQEGNIIKWYGTNTDIEDRKRVEVALRESEARFRNMADNAPVMVWVTEVDGACSYASQSWYEFTGQSPESALGVGWVAALHPDDREVSEKSFLAANENQEAFRLEYRLRRHDGEYRWAIDSARPRFDSQGEFLGYIGSVVDITETKQAELNTQFINRLDFELSQIADADEIIRLATSRLGEFLGASSCYVIEINPAADLAIVRESWHGWRHDAPNMVGEYRISDYVWPEFREALEAGQAAVVNDVMADPRTRDFASKYESLGVGAFISVPALNEKHWEASLNVNHSQARDWRLDETQLMRDVTARLWPAFKRARAVEALRDSEERFRQLAENIGAAFFITEGFSETPPGRLHYVSPAYEKIWGRSRESLYQDARSWLEAVHPDEIERVLDALRSAGRAHFDEEFRITRPDGEVRWVHDRVFPIRDELGEIYRLAGIVEDITGRKMIEEELRESEERYRSVVESQTELICRYLPDTTLTFVNDAYCRFFGKTQEELIGTKFLEFIPEPAREAARRHIESLVENPRVEMDEHEVLLPGGGIGWQQWVDHAILDANGKVVEFQAVGRDITERKQIEDKRREGEERLRVALEAGRMGVWEWVPKTNAVRWSKENFTILGLAPFSIEPDYHTWAGSVHPDDLPTAIAELDRAIAENREFRYEYRVILPDGSARWVEDRGKPVYDEGGKCVKVSGLIVDITERKESEEALRESEEALRTSYARIEDLAGRLIAAQEEERRHIARELHDDLNQQVAALAIGISRLKRQFPNADAAVLKQIANLRSKTDQLSEHIRQVSHELHSSVLQHVGLPAALNSYCAEFSEREGIAVTLDIRDDIDGMPPEAALCLYRVAQESLRNIAIHSGARNAVVTLAGGNGAIELRVADQGVGFDLAQARECHGLGLVSMEERVKLLHGSFELITRPGAGTELRAKIPLRRGHEQTKDIVG